MTVEKPKILLIEYDPDYSEPLKQVLIARGCDVKVIAEPAEASRELGISMAIDNNGTPYVQDVQEPQVKYDAVIVTGSRYDKPNITQISGFNLMRALDRATASRNGMPAKFNPGQLPFIIGFSAYGEQMYTDIPIIGGRIKRDTDKAQFQARMTTLLENTPVATSNPLAGLCFPIDRKNVGLKVGR